jgi:transcription antitermination protein NusB
VSHTPDERTELPPDWPRRSREAAVQMLYQWEVGRMTMPEVRRLFWQVGEAAEEEVAEPIRSLAVRLADGTVEHLAAIDPLIEGCSEHWRLARMPVVDRIVLRLATYELLHEREAPPAFVINEALELTRRFSTPDAVRFVNGVLDAVRKRLIESGTIPA